MSEQHPLISRPRSVVEVQPFTFERGSDLAEPLRAEPTSVREPVASIPAPGGDHRQHEDPAFAQQVLIDTLVVTGDFFGRVSEVELNGPTATRFEIDEQQPVLRGEQIARVRFAVEQLLGTATLGNCPSQNT